MENNEIMDIVNDFNPQNPALQKVDFCSVWPNVKSGLEMLRDLINRSTVTFAINGIIMLGDALKKKICG